jgi:ClpP class serine protease
VDAQRIRLVDHLGGLKDATQAAAKLADLGKDYDVQYIETELSLKEQLLMQIRSQAVNLGQLAGLIPEHTDIERILDPLLEQAHVIARLKDRHGLYSYCWCQEPSEQ